MTSPSPEQHERAKTVAEFEEIIHRCSEVYRPEGVMIWLFARNQTLGGRSPIQCVEAGDTDRVLAVLDMLISGAYA